MRRKSTVLKGDPDRFLVQRGGHFHYKRRVPSAVADLDDRVPHVRLSLKTTDLGMARSKRDALEAADNAFWAELLAGDSHEVAQRRYDAAVRRAEALGFGYRSIDYIAAGPVADYVRRLEALADVRTPVATTTAVLGLVTRPETTVTQALQIYLEQIAPARLVGKSREQQRQWRKIPTRAVANFVSLNGDLSMTEIERSHALQQFGMWRDRIAPPEGRPSHSPSSGNRDLGSMRVFYRDYFRHIGEPDRSNPFNGLTFSERRGRKTRPPLPVGWITTKLLAPGALNGLNDQARAILLAMVETGCRPSELCNLTAEMIQLDDAVPHLRIEPREDPDDPRETKTVSSIRVIPLIGVSLDAIRAFPAGFPRYRNRESAYSSLVNKFLRNAGLLPSTAHTVYSLRHTFEDRMKDGGFDTELRMMLMGHTIDRPQYGAGGSLEWKQRELARIALRPVVRDGR